MSGSDEVARSGGGVAEASAEKPAYRAPARGGSAPQLISQARTGSLNRTRLLQILYDAGPLSRADLARLADVAKTTIGSIVQPMLDEGLLVEGDPVRSSSAGGKPARPIWFSPTGRPIVAVHVLPGTVKAALVSPTGSLLKTASRSYSGTRSSTTTILDVVTGCIDSVLPSDDARVLGIGIAVSGIVDTDRGHIVAVNLAPRLSGLDLGPLVSESTGLPVHIDHHPRVQTLGDRWFGLGRRVSSFASIYCGEAIGAGFVIDGAVHRGPAGAGGEVGHTIVDLDGAICRCGRRGCWETVAADRWLCSQARSLGLPHPRSMNAGRLRALVEAGDSRAAALFDRYARNVAVGLFNLQQTLAPSLFILHGGVVAGGDALRERIEEHLLSGVAQQPSGDPQVVFAEQHDDTTMLGAAGLVLSQSLELLT